MKNIIPKSFDSFTLSKWNDRSLLHGKTEDFWSFLFVCYPWTPMSKSSNFGRPDYGRPRAKNMSHFFLDGRPSKTGGRWRRRRPQHANAHKLKAEIRLRDDAYTCTKKEYLKKKAKDFLLFKEHSHVNTNVRGDFPETKKKLKHLTAPKEAAIASKWIKISS